MDVQSDRCCAYYPMPAVMALVVAVWPAMATWAPEKGGGTHPLGVQADLEIRASRAVIQREDFSSVLSPQACANLEIRQNGGGGGEGISVISDFS